MRPQTTNRDIGMHTFKVEIVLEAQILKNNDELCQLFVHIQQWTWTAQNTNTNTKTVMSYVHRAYKSS